MSTKCTLHGFATMSFKAGRIRPRISTCRVQRRIQFYRPTLAGDIHAIESALPRNVFLCRFWDQDIEIASYPSGTVNMYMLSLKPVGTCFTPIGVSGFPSFGTSCMPKTIM